MPAELRHMLFTPSEVVDAVVAHRRRSGRQLPAGSVVTATVEQGAAAGQVSFRLVMAPDTTGRGRADEHLTFAFAAEELAAALMGFCRYKGIPLPLRAEKSLERFGSRLALVMHMAPSAEDKAAPPGAA